MGSQVVAEVMHDLVCCPRCRTPRPFAADGPCTRCGSVYKLEGPVIDFLGASAGRLPAGNDLAMAQWLIANHDGLRAVLRQLEQAHKNPRTAVDAFVHLTAGSRVTPAQVAEMIASGPIVQIMNDVAQLVTGAARPSETVDFLLAESHISPDSRVLDAGCSAGRHLFELSARGPRLLVGVDIHLLALLAGALAWQAHAPRQPYWCRASVGELPFVDAAFSHVVSCVTLSAVPIRRALAELSRVLAPGGRALLTVEGPGYWRSCWDHTPLLSRGRLSLLRWLLGSKLMSWGFDWQQRRLTRSLSGVIQLQPHTLSRLVEHAGFAVEKCQVLRTYRDRAALIGVVARKN